MIRVDQELTQALTRRTAASEPVHTDVGHVMRTTGIKALNLPDGTDALGWDIGNGTWGILRAADGNLRGTEWLAGILNAEDGAGFMTAEPTSLGIALRNALTMPSPLMADGSVMNERVADPAEAAEKIEEAFPASSLPSPR